MKQNLYLIAGANGSGKTTLARELLREEKITFLNTDEIAANIGDKLGFLSGKILLSQLDKILMAKEPFAIESTISGKYHFHILKQARHIKYEVTLIYMFIENVELNIARVQKRVSMGGHNVPEDDIRRRWKRSIYNFQETAKLADSWKIYYNGGVSYELIAHSTKGILEVQDENKYKIFNSAANYKIR